jgi:hypothetical protein
MNQNAGNKPAIPLNSSRAPQSSPSATIVDRISSQASAAAATATLASPSRPPAHPVASTAYASTQRKRRYAPATTKRVLKGIYFDTPVLDALRAMQSRGENVSLFVNDLVRRSLSL